MTVPDMDDLRSAALRRVLAGSPPARFAAIGGADDAARSLARAFARIGWHETSPSEAADDGSVDLVWLHVADGARPADWPWHAVRPRIVVAGSSTRWRDRSREDPPWSERPEAAGYRHVFDDGLHAYHLDGDQPALDVAFAGLVRLRPGIAGASPAGPAGMVSPPRPLTERAVAALLAAIPLRGIRRSLIRRHLRALRARARDDGAGPHPLRAPLKRRLAGLVARHRGTPRA